jgi:hypothetical protein
MKLTGRLTWIKHIVMEQRDLVIIVGVIVRAWKLQQVACLLGASWFANSRAEIDSSNNHTDEPLSVF